MRNNLMWKSPNSMAVIPCAAMSSINPSYISFIFGGSNAEEGIVLVTIINCRFDISVKFSLWVNNTSERYIKFDTLHAPDKLLREVDGKLLNLVL